MQGLLEEILEIPSKAKLCYENNKETKLPLNVPYIGMGSSYYAPLTLFYAGKEINPQIASEYYYYLSKQTESLGVLISQSGESSETVWNLEKFKEVISIVNYTDSSLGKSGKVKQVVQLFAGEEKYSSTKTYVNTLIALYLGLDIDPKLAIEKLERQFESYKEGTKKLSKEIAGFLKANQTKGLFVIGSGPNIGTALEGALILSETTKLSWVGMPVAQYDHGPKETAENTVVIILNGNGKDVKRIGSVKNIISKSNTFIVELKETDLDENLTPITLITQLNFIMNYLADELGAGNTFHFGGKVTTVNEAIK